MGSMVKRERIVEALTKYLADAAQGDAILADYTAKADAAEDAADKAAEAITQWLATQPVYYKEWELYYRAWEPKPELTFEPTRHYYGGRDDKVTYPEIPQEMVDLYKAAQKHLQEIQEDRPPAFDKATTLEFEAYQAKFEASKAPAVSVPDKVMDMLVHGGWLS